MGVACIAPAKGVDHEAIRGFRHDLGERTRIAINLGLVLRKRTAAHLVTPSLSNEYFVVRYAPTLSTALSQVNRVMATLSELSQKVPRLLKGNHVKSLSGDMHSETHCA